jgi:predicted O-methyltransferase YrrM
LDEGLRAVAEAAKGFMPPEEGLALYEAGLEAASIGPLLEIGSYCGKSTVYLGAAARERGTVLFTIDHHRGSEEMQSDWDHHDPEVVDPATGRMDSLPFLRRTIEKAGLEDTVVAIVGDSATVAKHWTTDFGLLFIDGAHSDEPAFTDYEGWGPKVVDGGLLLIHDVFDDPANGGQGPFRVYERALAKGFAEVRATGSLRALRKQR